ncbi:hemagglutinin-neuraminidase [Respirovirus P045T/pangolin/2018]|nr:hemagglutinin-neuraminidase [Respirovirus P021T/pangolin/2018]URG17228.1 hemagglutinin-neuraminidase [Respirovirus P030T/pangolin/2018]URG17234.1 hemagglutinin-neuraminidase [Respirovirus P040T/pangolin/2018]URG17240.1 hemagglutinin-neuraminidase [Respirovirus P045T/pangolin/2018]
MDGDGRKRDSYWSTSPGGSATKLVSDLGRPSKVDTWLLTLTFIQWALSTVTVIICIIIAARQGYGMRGYSVTVEAFNISSKELKDSLTSLIRQEVITRAVNIQSSVQTGIPVLLNKNNRDVIQMIEKSCNKQELTHLCESTIAVHHAEGIAPLEPHSFWRCPAGEPYLSSDPEVSLLPGPSLLSGSTTISGCVRLPSLSIGEAIYAYSSNLITQGCADIGKSYQVLQLGYISLNSDMFPDLNPVVSHTYDINDNRKSCSVVAAGARGYQLCSMPTVDERTDYSSNGIEDLVLDILDLKGRTKSHRYSSSEIDLDHPFSALYPGVGSGIATEGSLMFLGYGGLTTPLQGDTRCRTQGCQRVSQDTCNEALKITWLDGKQVVSVLIQVNDYLSERPKIKVTTIPITQNYLGAEGRLLKLGDQVYIYTRSSGWHSQLQIGILDVSHPLTINWTPHEALSRPGNEECNWYNTCPKECISGVYTDAYPLSPDAANVATVTLYANTSRVNPTIMYSNTTNIINMLRIKDVQLEAAYTTTSCITHFGKGYCFHIIEINQKSLNTLQPMLFKTSIPKLCKAGS